MKLTQLSPRQADYIGVPMEGPYKPEHYRYQDGSAKVRSARMRK